MARLIRVRARVRVRVRVRARVRVRVRVKVSSSSHCTPLKLPTCALAGLVRVASHSIGASGSTRVGGARSSATCAAAGGWLTVCAAAFAGSAAAAGRCGSSTSGGGWTAAVCLALEDRTLQAVGTNQRPYREKPASSSTGSMRRGDTLLLRRTGRGCLGMDRGCRVTEGMRLPERPG